ncbi:ATP synthase, putative [Eimeria brunetti]|uniref:ATP synthase, putative n=1 Tax=Eimeria brunetti TaxID=51314 RepID=U6LKU9_9EIME|nr:ATP synthase, putative [Eimeria brunetti]
MLPSRLSRLLSLPPKPFLPPRPLRAHHHQQRPFTSTTTTSSSSSSSSSSRGGGVGGQQRLLLTLASPSDCCMHRRPVFSVSLPSAEGQMEVTNGHVPLVARLRPGEVPQDDSGCSTAEILAVEMVPTDLLDKEAAAQQLQQLLQQAAAASDQWTKTKALLGQDLLSSVMRAAP